MFKKTFSQRCEKCCRIFSPEQSMPRHRAICEGFNYERDYLRLILTDKPDANLSVDDRFKDMYGFSIDEIYAIGDDEDEEEGEGGYEPIIFTPSNM